MTAQNPMPDQLSDAWLDSAASETLGLNTPEESAAYRRDLPAAGTPGQHLDRSLRETATQLSAASPYLAPPADLRGRILQASAPATFKIEDYRKATHDNGKFYRWGFYAAGFFLVAAAYYNLSIKSALKQTQQQVSSVTSQANTLLKKANAQAAERDAALAAFVDPNSQPVALTRDGKVFGKALVNQANHTALVILPSELVPDGQIVSLQLPENGKVFAYQTTLLKAPAKELNFQLPQGEIMQALQNPKTLGPDPSVHALNAGF